MVVVSCMMLLVLILFGLNLICMTLPSATVLSFSLMTMAPYCLILEYNSSATRSSVSISICAHSLLQIALGNFYLTTPLSRIAFIFLMIAGYYQNQIDSKHTLAPLMCMVILFPLIRGQSRSRVTISARNRLVTGMGKLRHEITDPGLMDWNSCSFFICIARSMMVP